MQSNVLYAGGASTGYLATKQNGGKEQNATFSAFCGQGTLQPNLLTDGDNMGIDGKPKSGQAGMCWLPAGGYKLYINLILHVVALAMTLSAGINYYVEFNRIWNPDGTAESAKQNPPPYNQGYAVFAMVAQGLAVLVTLLSQSLYSKPIQASLTNTLIVTLFMGAILSTFMIYMQVFTHHQLTWTSTTAADGTVTDTSNADSLYHHTANITVAALVFQLIAFSSIISNGFAAANKTLLTAM